MHQILCYLPVRNKTKTYPQHFMRICFIKQGLCLPLPLFAPFNQFDYLHYKYCYYNKMDNTSKDCMKKLLFFPEKVILFIIPTLLILKKQKLSHKTIIYNTVTRNICCNTSPVQINTVNEKSKHPFSMK